MSLLRVSQITHFYFFVKCFIGKHLVLERLSGPKLNVQTERYIANDTRREQQDECYGDKPPWFMRSIRGELLPKVLTLRDNHAHAIVLEVVLDKRVSQRLLAEQDGVVL